MRRDERDSLIILNQKLQTLILSAEPRCSFTISDGTEREMGKLQAMKWSWLLIAGLKRKSSLTVNLVLDRQHLTEPLETKPSLYPQVVQEEGRGSQKTVQGDTVFARIYHSCRSLHFILAWDLEGHFKMRGVRYKGLYLCILTLQLNL